MAGTRRVASRRSVVAFTAVAIIASANVTVFGARTALAAGAQTVSIGDASVVEGNVGSRALSFAVTLSAPSATTVGVSYRIVSTGSATPGRCSTPGTDFDDRRGATLPLSFPVLRSGVTAVTRAIRVTVCADTTSEPGGESFAVQLVSASSGWTITRGAAVGTVIDDDAPTVAGPQVSIGDASASEGNAGAPFVQFAVTLSEPATVPVTVSYSVTSGTATCVPFVRGKPIVATADCSSFNGGTKSMRIPARFVNGAIKVPLAPDARYEADETFTIHIQSATVPTFRDTATGTILNDDSPCNTGGAAPAQYKHVVVFSFENRTWTTAGGVGFATGPLSFFRSLAQGCSYYSSWTETDTTASSLTQYTGQMTGARQPGTIADCGPSPTCNTTADNIFRQARAAGKTAINYVEGATTGCAAAKLFSTTTEAWNQWVPDLYMWGADDRSHCVDQVRPYAEFDPNNMPDFAFISPNPCDNGHNSLTCGTDAAVNAWASAEVQKVLLSDAYQHGDVAVFIWYDEDAPVPNLQIAPTARPGPFADSGIGYASTLKAWEGMLGFPCLANACSAPDMRTTSGI